MIAVSWGAIIKCSWDLVIGGTPVEHGVIGDGFLKRGIKLNGQSIRGLIRGVTDRVIGCAGAIDVIV